MDAKIGEAINTSVNVLVSRITAQTTPDEALKFSQVALNLAHVALVLTINARE